MKTDTRVLVIGGGVAGVSTLYHLAKRGWTDVMLVEKLELTSGSTWHAAGNLPHFSGSYNIMKLQQYSLDLYSNLEVMTGSSVGKHRTGAVRLAHTEDRMDEFKRICGYSDLAGLEFRMLDNTELRDLYPYLNTEGLLGGLWDPGDGHIDPSQVTQAMAKGARDLGATIVRNNPVESIKRLDDGRWEVTTAKGVIRADNIVNAGGFRANEIAAMVGHQLPMISMEHQFLVTENIPALEDRDEMLPMLRDPDVSYYLRQEGKGLILGPYEPGGVPWAVDGVPPQFGQELLNPELDRLEGIITTAMEQVGLIGEAGIKTVVNGPITYTPDGHPLVGPAFGIDNYFLCTGFNFGITQGGGAGHFLSQMIIDGHPELDMWEIDPRRFGDYADKQYAIDRCVDVYANEYQLTYPNEYATRDVARNAKQSPAAERQAQNNAVMGAYYGWERASWFAPEGAEPKEQQSFRRGNWFEPVGVECRNVRDRAGLLDLSPFTKFEISGPGAEAFLDRISPNRVPAEIGGIALAHPVTIEGGVAWEFSMLRLTEDRFYIMCPAVAEQMISDYLRVRHPNDGSVVLTNTTKEWGCLVIAGPRSRDILSKLTDADLSNEGFPWFTGQEIKVGNADVRALRMNFVGELGWELHHPIEQQAGLYDALKEVGAEFGLSDFGLRAMDSMRLEKGYPIWGHDLTIEFSALEASLGWFVKLDKGDFEGRDALLAQKEAGVPYKLVTLEVDAFDADAIGMEPVFCNGELVGQVSSGGYGYRVQKSLALAYIKTDIAKAGTDLEVKILNERFSARVVKGCIYDPQNALLKDC